MARTTDSTSDAGSAEPFIVSTDRNRSEEELEAVIAELRSRSVRPSTR